MCRGVGVSSATRSELPVATRIVIGVVGIIIGVGSLVALGLLFFKGQA